MRGRLVLVGLVVAGSSAVAQFPQPPAPPIQVPRLPDPPKSLPPAQTAPARLPPNLLDPAQRPGVATPGSPAADVPLPYPEDKVYLDSGAVTVTRADGVWRVGSPGRVILATADEHAARAAARVLRDLRPTEWVRVGSPKPVVEYGLRGGKPVKVAGFPRHVVPLDLATARVEQVRGVWVVRDAANIVFNCGPHKADAEQALAVARKYGFNRVGMVGASAAVPALTYFFVGPDGDEQPRPAANPLAVASQEQALARTGVPLPGAGAGYVGEMVRIDPRKVEARRDGAEWVLAHGPDVLARFGPAEWGARDAARTVQDGRFTEFGTVGPVTFFLVGGRAPVRVSLSHLSRTFDPNLLAAREAGGRWVVVEPARSGQDKVLWEVATAAEAETLIRLVRHYRFDQVCRAGGGGLTFLARGR
ncbi:MAG: hypothetical protein K2X87_34725 [Gemmataceae bacterium]|nr:hypothetical protein [Gemmataceae bacterium]